MIFKKTWQGVTDMQCPNCGAEIPMNSSFCPVCGVPFLQQFDRVEFRRRARMMLGRRYWEAFAVSLVAGILMGGLNVAYRISGNLEQHAGIVAIPHLHPGLFLLLISIFNAIWILSVAYTIFISNAVEVGESRFFISTYFNAGEFADTFCTFKNRHYMKIIGSMAWRLLFLTLWTLLFIIPGIVKYYAYYMVPYILAENPDIGYQQALKLSMCMTDGSKGEIFILELSFLGWYLLGILCLGVGALFVRPYHKAAMTAMYLTMRDNAVKRGLCTYADFGFRA
jgi:uncharacterized membrane protein